MREENRHTAREAVDKARSIELENASRAFLAVLDITHATTLDLPRELDEALELLRGALELSRELSDARNEVICLNEIGKAYYRSGKAREALDPHVNAWALARRIGAVVDMVQAMNGLGAAESALRMPEAGDHLAVALNLARQARLPVEAAEAEYLLQQID